MAHTATSRPAKRGRQAPPDASTSTRACTRACAASWPKRSSRPAAWTSTTRPRSSGRSRRSAGCSTLCRAHLHAENQFLHPAMEARRPGSACETAKEHEDQVAGARGARDGRARGRAGAARGAGRSGTAALSPPGRVRRREPRAHARRGDVEQRRAVGDPRRRGARRDPAGDRRVDAAPRRWRRSSAGWCRR